MEKEGDFLDPDGDQEDDLDVPKSNSETCGSDTFVTKGSKTIQSNKDGSCDDSDENNDEVSQSEEKDGRSNSNDEDDDGDNDNVNNDEEESSSSSDYDSDQYTVDNDDQESGDYDETTFSEGVSLNPKTWKDLKAKNNGTKDSSGRTKGSSSSISSSDKVGLAETAAARSEAYEKLLLYAYAALSAQVPAKIVEKGDMEGSDDFGNKENMIYPHVLSPKEASMQAESMIKIIARLSDSGIEVLKLNRHKEWQPRILTVTKEFTKFNKSEDTRYRGIESCPQGLLWLKKFDKNKPHTVASIDKSGKGGCLFSNIEYLSVTKDNHALSRKQKKGKFKDSITFILHASNANGTKREILFRCMNKEDAFALSAGFQIILDRIRDASGGSSSIMTKIPLSSAKPFSPKATASPVETDRWEV